MTNNQQLAAHCRDVIANPQDHLDWVVDMARVALASVEAEPVEYLTWHQGCRAPDDCEIYANIAEKGDKSDDGSEAFPVYAAPPVPVMKPVVLPSTTCVGWVKEAIQEHDAKWIEAIRAAGGSVKE